MSPEPPAGDISTIPYRVGLLETAMLTEAAERKAADKAAFTRIDNLEDKWARLEGAFGLVKFALGTSIVSMILGLAAIWALASGNAP